MVGSHWFLEVELHSLSAWESHDDDHEGNDHEYRLGGAPHTPDLVPDGGEGDCSHPVLVSESGG